MFVISWSVRPQQAFPTKPNVCEYGPRVDQLKGASLGQASALLTKIILDCKGLPVTNTLAYYKHS